MHFLVAPKLQVMTNLDDLELKCQVFSPSTTILRTPLDYVFPDPGMLLSFVRRAGTETIRSWISEIAAREETLENNIPEGQSTWLTVPRRWVNTGLI